MNTEMNSEEIARRAYSIYEREGRQEGKDFEHWMRAEAELREEVNGRQTSAATNGAAPTNSSPAGVTNSQNRTDANVQGDARNKGGNGKKSSRPAAPASRN
jgi:hypothetical protein